MPRAWARCTVFLATCVLTATAAACSSHGSQGQRGSSGGQPTLSYNAARGSGCGGTRVRLGGPPSWASGPQHGFHHGGANKVPYALSSDGKVLAYLWGWPLAVHPDSVQDKVLWFATSGGGPLHISGHRIGAAQPVFSETISGGMSGTGMPSYVQTPAPGCWHLTLTWNYSQRSSINLQYVAHR